jgi:hypothetical protein
MGPAEAVTDLEVDENFRIYFPSHDTVAKSKGGVGVSQSQVPCRLPSGCEVKRA